MKSTILQEIIKKITKFKKELITIDELGLLTTEFFDSKKYGQKLYKMIYYLKQRGYLLSIKKDLFIIKNPDDTRSENHFIEERYWNILVNHCKKLHKSQWYIGGETALSFHLKQYSIPDTITIINPEKQGYEILVSGKKIQWKIYTQQQKNITKQLIKLQETVVYQGSKLPIASLSLALLETLYNNDPKNPLILDLVKKTLKKHKTFEKESFQYIIKLGKHHTSINHLYHIAKEYHPPLAGQLHEVIKKRSFFL